MVEKQVQPVVLSSNIQRVLASQERKACSQFKKELLNVSNEAGFNFALVGILGERKEIEVVRVLKQLLGQVGLWRW